MPQFVAMSSTEINFIKVYAAALRRHYSALQSVISIMNPNVFGVKNFYTATQLAVATEKLHDDFDRRISVWRKKHKPKLVSLPPYPDDDDLADLFSISFFKLLRAADEDENTLIDAAGWFSGNPDEWQTSVSSYTNAQSKDTHTELNNILSQCFNAFAKLFGHNTFFSPPHKHGKKMWPPPANDGYSDADDLSLDDEDT